MSELWTGKEEVEMGSLIDIDPTETICSIGLYVKDIANFNVIGGIKVNNCEGHNIANMIWIPEYPKTTSYQWIEQIIPSGHSLIGEIITEFDRDLGHGVPLGIGLILWETPSNN